MDVNPPLKKNVKTLLWNSRFFHRINRLINKVVGHGTATLGRLAKLVNAEVAPWGISANVRVGASPTSSTSLLVYVLSEFLRMPRNSIKFYRNTGWS